MTNLNRKISQMEDEFDQLAQRHQLTLEKYEETVKVADECEKLVSFIANPLSVFFQWSSCLYEVQNWLKLLAHHIHKCF